MVTLRSTLEDQSRPRICPEELLRKLGLGEIGEWFASAVKRNNISGIKFLEGGDGLAQVIGLIGGQMEAPDDRIDLVNAGYRLDLLDRIDQPSMAA